MVKLMLRVETVARCVVDFILHIVLVKCTVRDVDVVIGLSLPLLEAMRRTALPNWTMQAPFSLII